MKKVNILLVDDDDICQLIGSKAILSMGLANEVHYAHNGKEALDVFNSYFCGEIAIPNVILLDLNMPIVDGFEFIRAFQQLKFLHKEKVLIIITTSSISSYDIDKAHALGIKYYLTKPLTEEKIRTAILEEFQSA